MKQIDRRVDINALDLTLRLSVEVDRFAPPLYENADEIESERGEMDPPFDDDESSSTSSERRDDVNAMFDSLRESSPRTRASQHDQR